MSGRIACALAAAALLTAVASTARADPAAPRAADCTACARTCTGRCEAQAGGCVCKAALPSLADCYAACARQAAVNASALEECRANCRSQSAR